MGVKDSEQYRALLAKHKREIIQMLDVWERAINVRVSEIAQLRESLRDARVDSVRLDWLCTSQGSRFIHGQLTYYGDLDRKSIDTQMEEHGVPNPYLASETGDQAIFRWLDKRMSELRFEQFLEVLRRAYKSWLSEGHLGESRTLTFRGLVERAMKHRLEKS